MRLLILFVFSVYSVLAQGSRALILADTDAPKTPTDSPGGGTYSSTQSVTLSDATATIILYTTNGSTPACPATGTLYTGAISVAVTTTIKAIGCNGVTGGGVLTSVYTISGLNGFTHSRSLTIDHTKVPNTDQTNFPVLVSTTIANWKSTGNGGSVTDAQGDDIVFTSDSGCTTLLSYELESWTASTGAAIFWVKVASVSHTSDTVFYTCYGKASITTFQGGSTGAAWKSAYKQVLHFSAGLSVADSTANGNNGTNNGATANTGGQIGGAAALVAASTQWVESSILINTTNYSSGTLSCWAYSSVAYNGGTELAWAGQHDNDEITMLKYTDSNFYVGWNGGAGGDKRVTLAADGTSFPQNSWSLYHFTWVNNGTSNFLHNGVSLGTTSGATVTTDTGVTLGWGQETNNGSGGRFWDGRLDECRIRNDAETADEALTDFNSQNSPSTFITVGSEI